MQPVCSTGQFISKSLKAHLSIRLPSVYQVRTLGHATRWAPGTELNEAHGPECRALRDPELGAYNLAGELGSEASRTSPEPVPTPTSHSTPCKVSSTVGLDITCFH